MERFSLNSKEIYNRFIELNKYNHIECVEAELNEFLMSGLIFQSGKKYLSRDNKEIYVDLIKSKVSSFDLDLSSIISKCQTLASENNIKRVYCMSERCYNNYKENNLIVNIDNKDYYRYYNNEYWLVYVV